jgi:DNA-binding beta-propeller fold protein YncE
MRNLRHILSSLLTISFVAASLPAFAQVVTATLPSATNTFSAAVNPATNKTYVANFVCPGQVCPGPGTVTVINGANNSTTPVTVGVYPYAVAVNATTNKIYVGNACGTDVNCNSPGTVTVIDGATNNTTSVTVGYYPYSLAVNPSTNMIYVGNLCGNDPSCSSPGTVTVIDANNNYSTATVNVGVEPNAVAVNPTTNFIYVANAACFNFPSCTSAGTVTAINGSNNSTQTVNVGIGAFYLAVNSNTNKIYVSNDCGNDSTCSSPGTVTVIDGATNNTSTVNVGFYPEAIVVNPVTNQTYVANNCSNNTCSSAGTTTVINGNNNYSTTTVPAAYHPVYLDIDTVTNKVYVANTCGNDPTCSSPGTLTVIDGATNSTFPIAVGDEPNVLAVNSSTHNVYVPNFIDNTISVVGGETKLQLVSVTPCRLEDTRSGSPIQGGTFATFNLPQLAQTSGCANLSTAAAYSLNVTLVPLSGGRVRYLTIWPAAESQPGVSLMNSLDGRTKADAAIVPAGVSGGVSVYVTDTANVILDIDGYFAPSSQSTLQFYPLTPCRVADSRSSDYPQGLGLPHLSGGVARDFPVLNNTTCIPQGINAAAYSFNLTAIAYPSQGNPLGYLEVWPTGSQPANPVSTLNNPTGTNVANAAIVPAGTSGEITVYASNNTDLAIDINGYFASTGSNGLSLYPTAPCRVIDTRNIGSGQPFSGVLSPPVDVVDSACGVPSVAAGYVFNATVIPAPKLRYLTLWPDGETQPIVSTLNAGDGFVTSNMAVVPNMDGKVNAYASDATQLILDISSYFAP